MIAFRAARSRLPSAHEKRGLDALAGLQETKGAVVGIRGERLGLRFGPFVFLGAHPNTGFPGARLSSPLRAHAFKWPCRRFAAKLIICFAR